MVTLSITTCKRFDLFEKTIRSFYDKCLDRELIRTIHHFDDSSSEEDREKMRNLISSLFVGCEIREYHFNADSFESTKRHCCVMNEWIRIMKGTPVFNFHLEDDWVFKSEFQISILVNLLEENSDIAYVGVSQFLREFPDEINPVLKGDFWKWYYNPERELLCNLFLDKKAMEKENVDGFWCYFINWPYFGFRPGIWDTRKLKEIDSMNCQIDGSFELDFAYRLSKKYVSYCTIDSVCDHIGTYSAYDLNNSSR